MTDYIHHTQNIIDIGAGPLPKSWRNVSGLDRANASALRAHGWLPVVYEGASYDPTWQARTGPVGCNVGDTVNQGAQSVAGVYTVSSKTGGELALAISAEMERRMNVGVVLSSATVADGVRFRCDSDGLIRITGLKDVAVFPFSFRTHSGALVTVATQAQATAIHGEVLAYVAALISASAPLQGQALGGTFTGDPGAWTGWPEDGS